MRGRRTRRRRRVPASVASAPAPWAAALARRHRPRPAAVLSSYSGGIRSQQRGYCASSCGCHRDIIVIVYDRTIIGARGSGCFETVSASVKLYIRVLRQHFRGGQGRPQSLAAVPSRARRPRQAQLPKHVDTSQLPKHPNCRSISKRGTRAWSRARSHSVPKAGTLANHTQTLSCFSPITAP